MKSLSLFALVFCCILAKPSQAQVYTSASGDLQVVVQYFAQHDSTQCLSTLQVQYMITKQNSFTNELIEVKDMFGNVLSSVVNSTGANPFNTFLPAGFGFAPDYGVNNNMAFFNVQPCKVIASLDTIYNIDNNYLFTVNDPCIYNYVSGKIYLDNNNDCSFNSGDVALNGLPISIQVNTASGDLGYGAASDFNGNYSMQVQESWMTSVDVSVPSYYQFAYQPSPCQTTSYTVMSLPAAGLDFAFQCGSSIDVQSGAFSSGVVRPNIPFMLHPFVNNMGCDAASGTLQLVLDSRVTYLPSMSYNPPSNIVGDTLYWDYVNLTNLTNSGYWNSFFSGIYLVPDNSVNIGDTLCFAISSTILSNDINASNNAQQLCLAVVNSYDPNAKSAVPAAGLIPATTETITYTIQFQNTGNAPAIDVILIDTLDTRLDINTFRVLGSSHSMQPEWADSRVLRFSFMGINLPDSMTNEPESHGYVTYQIDLEPNLAYGTSIYNTAHIYFDNNPAIVTNTTEHIIDTPTDVQTTAANEYRIYPNPTRDIVYLHSEALGAAYRLTDLWGRTVQTGTISEAITSFDLRELPAGMYILQWSDAAKAVKIVKE